jgi:hypothetical protein
MKLSVPGLSSSEGKKLPPPLDNGRYQVEVPKVPTAKESEKSPGTNISWEFTVIAGPDQNDGSDPNGRVIRWNTFIMDEDHPQYEDYHHIGIDELADFANAFGVNVTRSNNIQLDDFQGKVAVLSVGQKEEEYEGEKRIRNTVKKAFPIDEEEGAE